MPTPHLRQPAGWPVKPGVGGWVWEEARRSSQTVQGQTWGSPGPRGCDDTRRTSRATPRGDRISAGTRQKGAVPSQASRCQRHSDTLGGQAGLEGSRQGMRGPFLETLRGRVGAVPGQEETQAPGVGANRLSTGTRLQAASLVYRASFPLHHPLSGGTARCAQAGRAYCWPVTAFLEGPCFWPVPRPGSDSPPL